MDINEFLMSKICPDERYIDYEYGLTCSQLNKFMKLHPNNRRNRAINIIKSILEKHGKQKMLPFIAELSRVEYGIRQLDQRLRDHLAHSILCFILGVYLNDNFLSDIRVKAFEWKLAGLLHDVGYPVQIANELLYPFKSNINKIKNKYRANNPDIRLNFIHEGLDILSNGISSFDLLQKRINEWELDINTRYEYNRMIKDGKICHGIVSSILLIYTLDLMYQKHNPKRKSDYCPFNDIKLDHTIDFNQTLFINDIVSACSAIFIHNLPTKRFKYVKIKREKATLAFLLRLADCLQDWQRPSNDNESGNSANVYFIQVQNKSLIFYAPENRIKKIKDDISCLEAPDIQIRDINELIDANLY